ncbi:MAG: CopG family transcriptional regulator [Verrucomicrobiaceae bacterium]
MRKEHKRGAGVMLDPDVIEFLTHLAGKEGRSRSWLINYIIRLHIQQLVEKQRAARPFLQKVISF